MHGEQDGMLEREQRLDDVVAAYLKAVETGEAPDRQQWLTSYPELAAELSEFFADQDQFDQRVAPLRAVAEISTSRKGVPRRRPHRFRSSLSMPRQVSMSSTVQSGRFNP